MFSKKIRYLTTTSLLALFVLAPALAITPVNAQTPTITPAFAQASAIMPLATSKCPDCWAGYGDNAAAGSVTMVTATVVQQAVTCDASNALTQGAGDVVAIDGTVGSADFLYVGTAAICSQGSSTPTYFMLDSGPGGSIYGASISPGDKITMTVKVSAGVVHFSFKDATSGTKGADKESASGFTLQSATCMSDMFGGYAQAQFTKVSFTKCKATIGGTTKAIGAFGASATLNKYICVDSTGTTTLAKPSSLSATHSNFKVSWMAAGP